MTDNTVRVSFNGAGQVYVESGRVCHVYDDDAHAATDVVYVLNGDAEHRWDNFSLS